MGWVYREVVGHHPGAGVIARRGGWLGGRVGGSGWREMIVTSYLRHGPASNSAVAHVFC